MSWTNHPEKERVIAEIREVKVSQLTAREKAVLMNAELEKTGASSFSDATVAENFLNEDGIIITPNSHNDSERHMPKSYKVVLNDYDRVYWLNILIACEGKVAGEINEEIRSRSNVVLTNAINDLEAFVEFYSPPMFGDPLAIDHHKIARSAGYFMHTERLFNPTLQDFKYAIESAKKWVRLNQSDPEFKSLQINVCFAGHGGYDNNGNGVVEFKNTDMSAQELASSIFSILPSKSICDNRHRVDLFFDCCHAGAFALDFLKVVKQTNPKMVSQNKAEEYDDGAPIGGIGLGRIFCSSMHDEESLEEDLYQHGLFTYAFLNEFSAKNVRKNGMPNLGLSGIGQDRRVIFLARGTVCLGGFR